MTAPTLATSTKLLRFALAGGVTFVLYYSLLWLTFGVARWPYAGAICISYLAAVIFHFVSNRHLTFRAEDGHVGAQLVRYALLAVLNYGIQVLIAFLGYELLGLPFYFCAFIGVAATMVSGFVLMNRWVFRRAEEAGPQVSAPAN